MTEGPNTCPHCGADPCLRVWRKLTLGPSAKTACPRCGFRVTVAPLQGWVAMGLPWIVLILAAIGLVPVVPATALFAVTFLLCIVLYLAWVPLSPWDISNPRAVAIGIERMRAARAASGHPDPTDT